MKLTDINLILRLTFFVLISALLSGCTKGSNIVSEEGIVSIDVFIKCSSNVDETITLFNKKLEAEGLIKKYELKPFIENHPVHLTLYLTEYNIDELNKIKGLVKNIADNTKKFPIDVTKISLTAGNWIMLDVEKPGKNNNNSKLQFLSDEIVSSLSSLRYKNSVIPSWAINIPLKRKSFEMYGSPNVYNQFDPHFSILAASISPEDQKTFSSDTNMIIESLNIKPFSTESQVLGIGLTDNNGQVTTILETYPLK